jgi:hypothetical protein
LLGCSGDIGARWGVVARPVQSRQSVPVALTDFQKDVSLRLNEGQHPEAIATSLGVSVDSVMAAKEAYERWARDAPPMPATFPTGPYSDEELRPLAEHAGTDVASLRESLPGG